MLNEYLNTIICGDCLTVMKQLPSESIDLVITSPPYNLSNSSGNWCKSDSKNSRWANSELRKGYDNYSDNMQHSEYVCWQRECLTEMMRIIKDKGAIFYNHKWRVQNGILQDRQDIVNGFPVRQIIIWQRAGGINFNDNYFLPTYEVIYLIAKPKFKLKPTANAHGDIWKINQENNNPHPAPFPTELVDRIINSTFAKVVLDPFSGSGTTAVVAKRLGVDYIGIELSETYCEDSIKRIKNIPIIPKNSLFA